MFIAFEGIDGSGKSTAIQAVAAALQATGTAWTTREETDGPWGVAVRESIAAKENPHVTTVLFLADRRAHANDIARHLAQGDTVLSDRYLHSTLAYQSVTTSSTVQELRDLHQGLPIPDRVILLDLPAEVAVDRAQARGETTPYEKVEFLEKVRQAYLGLVDESFAVLDASQSAEDVAKAAIAALNLD